MGRLTQWPVTGEIKSRKPRRRQDDNALSSIANYGLTTEESSLKVLHTQQLDTIFACALCLVEACV